MNCDSSLYNVHGLRWPSVTDYLDQCISVYPLELNCDKFPMTFPHGRISGKSMKCFTYNIYSSRTFTWSVLVLSSSSWLKQWNVHSKNSSSVCYVCIKVWMASWLTTGSFCTKSFTVCQGRLFQNKPMSLLVCLVQKRECYLPT